MRVSHTLFVVITLCLTFVSIHGTGGIQNSSKKITPYVIETLSRRLAEASQLAEKTSNGPNFFDIEGMRNVQILHHTVQVVSGMSERYIIKFDDNLGTYIASIHYWDAPWEVDAGLQSACIVNLSTADGSCKGEDQCAVLLNTEGKCVYKNQAL